MTQEEKQLLLKDLSARLPYGVKILADIFKTFDGGSVGIITTIEPYVGTKYPELKGSYLLYQSGNMTPYTVDEVKPYLRSMSSMTDKEKEEYHKYVDIDLEKTAKQLKEQFENGTFDKESQFTAQYHHIDWLNEHHFDYRGLIPMGLALEAPEDMY